MEMTIYLIIWSILLVIFIIAEMATAALVSIWFVVGALAAMLAAAMGWEFLSQCYVFVGISIITFLATRPFVSSLKIKKVPTNSDEIVGMEGIVLVEVNNLKSEGRAQIQGIDWAAKSATGQIIPEGAVIRVDKLEGVTVYVMQKESGV